MTIFRAADKGLLEVILGLTGGLFGNLQELLKLLWSALSFTQGTARGRFPCGSALRLLISVFLSRAVKLNVGQQTTVLLHFCRGSGLSEEVLMQKFDSSHMELILHVDLLVL